MGISKATRVFESPLLSIWQFECSVHIFRGPLFNPIYDLLDVSPPEDDDENVELVLRFTAESKQQY